MNNDALGIRQYGKKIKQQVFNCVAIILDGEKVDIAKFDNTIVSVLEVFSKRYNFTAYEVDKIIAYCDFQYRSAFGIIEG